MRIVQTTRIALRLLLALVGASLLVDPLIPGQATVYVHAPADTDALPRNLRVRIAPVRLDGSPDPLRMTHARFDDAGTSVRSVSFRFFETRLNVRVCDATRPRRTVRAKSVRLSPLEKQGVCDLHVTMH